MCVCVTESVCLHMYFSQLPRNAAPPAQCMRVYVCMCVRLCERGCVRVWENSDLSAGETRFLQGVVIAQRFSFCKYPKSAPT